MSDTIFNRLARKFNQSRQAALRFCETRVDLTDDRPTFDVDLGYDAREYVRTVS